MRWFRSRAKVTSWLALFALAAQLAVSFGHVHAERPALPTAAAALQAGSPVSGDVPAVPGTPDRLADDFCAICALIHLAGTLIAGAAPSLPAPATFSQTRFQLIVAIALTAPPHASFRARAPPIA
jgi:hypothetical protein